MSDSSSSHNGKKHLHLQAARNWLDRAESQIESGMDIMAAATLMLAQAELKIMVEKIAVSPVTESMQQKSRPSGLPRVSRALLAGAAVAACLVFGMVIGRMTAPTVEMAPIQLTQAGTIIPDNPQLPVADEHSASLNPAADENFLIVDVSDREAVAGMAFPGPGDETIDTGIEPYGPPLPVTVDTPASSSPRPRAPYYPPVTESQPLETPSPVTSTLPATPEEPQAAGSHPEEIPTPETVLSSAEVALWTILALSDRLNGVMN